MEVSNNKHYSGAFKATVALAALRREGTTAEVAARYAVPPALVTEWANTLEQEAEFAFSREAAPHAELDFFDNRELAKIIAENSTQGFAMMNRAGICIYANQAWLDMTGYSIEEIGVGPLHYLVHHHHPDGTPYPMEDCPIDRALPENFDVRAHNDLFFRKDGSSFEVLCAASPIFHSGQAVATVIEIRDVTAQNRQARRMLESEQRALSLAEAADQQQRRLNAFLDAAPVGIGLADANGALTLVNRANKELWGQNFHQASCVAEYSEFKGWWADGAAHHGQRLEPEEWALARALRGEKVDNDIVEIEPFDQPGTRRTVSLSARPICDSSGVIYGSVVAQVDITKQKIAEETLRQSDRNKDDFLAMLAHELRNPLAPIRTAIELFGMRQLEDPLLKKASSIIGRQVNHMIRMVDDLLDLARISRGKVQLKAGICDVVRVVHQTVEDYRAAIEASGVALRITVPPYAIWVQGDDARIAQIVSNLLHNAEKFTKSGQVISVGIGEHAEGDSLYVDIRVADNGVGIAPELIKTLFSPFVQANQGLGRTDGGLGLGLSLVKGLAELHGGRVSATSEGNGRGSTFTVSLPVCIEDDHGLKLSSGNVAPVNLNIVAIDDNEDILEMLSELLRLHGHAVSLAYDGKSGLAAVRELKPDVVICDIGLPDALSGYDVARAIRSDAELSQLTIIAISGYGQESDKRKSAAAGFNAHLVKPVGHEELLQVLNKVEPKPRTP